MDQDKFQEMLLKVSREALQNEELRLKLKKALSQDDDSFIQDLAEIIGTPLWEALKEE
jgi:hypothetical protein